MVMIAPLESALVILETESNYLSYSSRTNVNHNQFMKTSMNYTYEIDKRKLTYNYYYLIKRCNTSISVVTIGSPGGGCLAGSVRCTNSRR